MKLARDELLAAWGAIEKICFVPVRTTGQLSVQAAIFNLKRCKEQEEERTGKRLDLFSDDVNATVITGIQLQHHLSHILRAVYPPCKGKHSRGFAGSGRAI